MALNIVGIGEFRGLELWVVSVKLIETTLAF